jgi:hypothetical protein
VPPNNVIADPRYANIANGDYRIRTQTRCAAKFTGPSSNLYTL